MNLDKKRLKKSKLIFLAANIFLDEDYLNRLSARFNEVYPSSGLPGSCKSIPYPVPVFVNKVQDVECDQESIEKVIECYKENIFCKDELLLITESLCSVLEKDTEQDTTLIFCFICKEAFHKDSHGTSEFDEEKQVGVITVAFQRLDGIVSTVFHELYELLVEVDEADDLHCDLDCFMNPDSVALTLCDNCKKRFQE